MCGIAGVVSWNRSPQLDLMHQDMVEAMTSALVHRGPDDRGVLSLPQATFGATRLAIRGLTDGKQPIVDHVSGVMAVCNGEIDNHEELRQWLSKRGRVVSQATDIAVIPALYAELGDQFIEHLTGVFGLAIWDPQRQRLLLGRDRAGERHLYYAYSNRTVRFATELAAMIEAESCIPEININILQDYLAYGFCPGTDLPFCGVCKLKPATLLIFDDKGIQNRDYWRWPMLSHFSKRSGSLKEFDSIFREAIERQTDVNVNYGIFLSGGLDSSLVAAVTMQVRPERQPQAYTLRFAEASYDEGDYASEVARLLNIESCPIWLHAQDVPTILSNLIETTGELLADPAWIPTAVLARHSTSSLVLSGEGADELFGGYPTYLGALLSKQYTQLPSKARAILRYAIRKWPASDKKVTLGYLAKRFVAGEAVQGLTRHKLWTSAIAPELLTKLGITEKSISIEQDLSACEILDQLQQYDFEATMAEGLLIKLDRACMSAAVEVRSPFLDQQVAEYAAMLPAYQRVNRLQTKVFLKQYALRYLPSALVHRRKRGFSLPLAQWLRGPLYSWTDDTLRRGLLDEIGVSSQFALHLLREHGGQRADHARALWTLIVLCHWLSWAMSKSDYQTATSLRAARQT